MKRRTTIENTAKTGVRPEFLSGGAPREIEAQEARGQDQLVNSHDLPVQCGPNREALEAAGVTFGEPKKGDPLFCRAELPAGWSKQATDHSMWSNLVDETGTVRAIIFYNAAFYDRDAFMNVCEPPTNDLCR